MSEPLFVRVGRITIPVPEGVRRELADDIAERLTSRLAEIEAKSTRVDTQIFALQLAFEYALRLHALSEEQQEISAGLTKALSQLNEELEILLATKPPEPPKTTPFPRPTT
jgi:hypothetical protein